MRRWRRSRYAMSDYSVIWSGASKQPLTSGDGWDQRRGSYLTTAADTEGMKRSGDLPAQREMIGKTDLDGLQVREAGWRARAPRCACGRLLSRSGIRDGKKRCWPCLKAKRNMQRKVA